MFQSEYFLRYGLAAQVDLISPVPQDRPIAKCHGYWPVVKGRWNREGLARNQLMAPMKVIDHLLKDQGQFTKMDVKKLLEPYLDDPNDLAKAVELTVSNDSVIELFDGTTGQPVDIYTSKTKSKALGKLLRGAKAIQKSRQEVIGAWSLVEVSKTSEKFFLINCPCSPP